MRTTGVVCLLFLFALLQGCSTQKPSLSPTPDSIKPQYRQQSGAIWTKADTN